MRAFFELHCDAAGPVGRHDLAFETRFTLKLFGEIRGRNHFSGEQHVWTSFGQSKEEVRTIFSGTLKPLFQSREVFKDLVEEHRHVERPMLVESLGWVPDRA